MIKKIKIFLIITITTVASIFLVIIIFWQLNYIDFSRRQIILNKNTQCNLNKNNSQPLILISESNLDRPKEFETLEYHIENMVRGNNSNIRHELTRSLTNYDKKFIKNCTEQVYYQASLQSQASFDNIYKLNDDLTIDQQFENLKQKFATAILDENWLYPDNSVKPLFVDIDWNVLLKPYLNNNAYSYQFKKELISFFKVFFKQYGEKNVLKLLFTLVEKANGIINNDGKINNNIVAVTSYLPNLTYQYMVFNDRIFNKQLQYFDGFWSSKNLTASLVHEYGHALENFLSNNSSEREQFNNLSSKNEWEIKDILKNDLNLENWTKKYLNIKKVVIKRRSIFDKDNFISASDLMLDFFANEVGIQEKQQKYLLAWSIINSGYGRLGGKRELFAEAFSQWLGTSKERRGLNWELLNKFFLNYLPTYL